MRPSRNPALALLLGQAAARTFPYETAQLSRADIEAFPAVDYADWSTAPEGGSTTPECRAWPGSDDWPSDAEWQQLNATVGGELLRPDLPSSACYPSHGNYDEQTCRWLINDSGRTHFWVGHPLPTLTRIPQGNTCPLVLNAPGTCTRGGFPEYVVKATTVKQIQAAVNFARNKNVRLVIKNTGHDFGGRSMGAGALSIWVHHIKNFEFMPQYALGDYYSGMAVHVGAGIESWELSNHMARHDIAVVAPGGRTVGVAGGWMAVAGHGLLTSKYGLGADQVLAINVVTPDGRFVSVNATSTDPHDRELFWALRGGGPGTFGVVTSVVMKAYPPSTVTSVGLTFSVDASRPGFPGSGTTLTNLTTFWRGVSHAYQDCPRISGAGGFCYSYIRRQGPSAFTFTSTQIIADVSAQQARALLQPLYRELNRLGIRVALPAVIRAAPYAGDGAQTGTAAPANTRYRSRLFSAPLWHNTTAWDGIFDAIRAGVAEAGYTFHGISYSPRAPRPDEAPSAVIPDWRSEHVLHASLMEDIPEGLSAAEARALDERAAGYVARWGPAAAYMNEADPAEEDWQEVFYGERYRRLFSFKQALDPWGVLWAPTTPMSEFWEVRTEDGYPGSQNGRLCRVKEGA